MKKTCWQAIFFFRREKICWVGSLEKLKINYVLPKAVQFVIQVQLHNNFDLHIIVPLVTHSLYPTWVHFWWWKLSGTSISPSITTFSSLQLFHQYTSNEVN